MKKSLKHKKENQSLKTYNILPRNALLTIYKFSVQPHLNYGDIVHDQRNNQSFSSKIETGLYNAALVITNVMKGTFRMKLYKELGIELLGFCRCFRRVCTFCKIKTQRVPKCLYKLISFKNNTYDTLSTHPVGTYFCRINAFKYSFFIYTIREWNKLDLRLRNEKIFMKFRNTLLKLGRPTPELRNSSACRSEVAH